MKTACTFVAFSLMMAALPVQPQETMANTSAAGSSNDSAVRIVRLSQVRGTARIDRGVGGGFESAFANIPITEKTKLETTDGSAEIEFEDNSTLRLTPETLIEFVQLDRDASGTTNSTVRVVRGTVYVDFQKAKGNIFTISGPSGTVTLSSHSTTRYTVGSANDGFAVFQGSAIFQGDRSKPMSVGWMKEVLFDPSDQTKGGFVSKLAPGPSDSWEQEEKAFHEQYSGSSALSGSPYLYGITDLNYYGSFANLPGCGRVWRPYFASATWDPYSSGVWAWYPVSGYSWVSPYPWGWAPFHYGAWQQCSSGVWGWAPGGTWRGLKNTIALSPSQNSNGKFVPVIHPAPEQPASQNNVKMLFTSTRPAPISGVNPAAHAFIFRNDSAGLGIPRKTFGELNKLSVTAQQSGTASTPVYAVRSWTVRTANGESGEKGLTQRVATTIWVPANDPRLLQAANNADGKDGAAGSDVRPSERVKGSPEFQAAVAGADGSDAHAMEAAAAARRRPSTSTLSDGNATPTTPAHYPPGKGGGNQ